MGWFADALQRHGRAKKGLAVLPPALGEWFDRADFRGCAFINGVSELGDSVPEVNSIARRHKQDMADLLETLLPPSPTPAQEAQALALVVEGAIVRAQLGEPVPAVLASVSRLLTAFAPA